ncbi:hypothetical protein LTR66_011696 [Elasticomyces elasticus]|nr:hypothetical protein LTR66_011696 [Elasticomyces elasticus]
MLDPVTALSVASGVLQIIDFSTKVLVKGQEIYKSGSTAEYAEVEGIATQLGFLSSSVKTSLSTSTAKTSSVYQIDRTLTEVAAGCCAIADELLLNLSGLKLPAGNKSVWEATKRGFKSVWRAKNIKSLQDRLDKHQNLLETTILVALRSHFNEEAARQDDRFKALQGENKGIITAILDDHKSVESIGAQVSRSNDLAVKRHEQVLAAIEALRLAPASAPRRSHSTDRNRRHSQQRHMDKNDAEEVTDIVLNCLKFRVMGDRLEQVSETHQETFDWIFESQTNQPGGVPGLPSQEPQSGIRSLHSFADWLRNGTHCYWINGKAASGKSTLMKHIVTSPRTESALCQWAGGTSYLTASFFFWNAGTTLQKSQEGLLRSLLYEILRQRPELVPKAMPDSWHEAEQKYVAAVTTGPVSIDPPTEAELRKGLRSMSEWATGSLKACIFIDGIDEFDGDHAKLAAFLKEISSPSIRMVLSSRPILACEEIFAYCQNLKLQDLNLPDITRYVNDKLATQEQMRELVAAQPFEAPQLFQEIISKASGVFLWVVLVVASLLSGLRNFDSISDLRRRLEDLPPELHALYAHMLARMEPLYRKQASQLFQLVRCAELRRNFGSPSTILLSYADEEEIENMALNAPLCPISDAELDLRVRRMDKRLRSRCCGLIEIHHFGSTVCGSKMWTTNDSQVEYLHRTVTEFLARDDIWDQLLEYTASSDFWPEKRLMQSYLIMLKKSRDVTYGNHAEPAHSLIFYALQSERCTKPPQMAVLDEMDRVLSLGRTIYSSHWSSSILPPYAGRSRSKSRESFFSFTVRCGLALYVQEALQRKGNSIMNNSDLPILFHAICPALDETFEEPLAFRFDLIDTLLRHGARVDATHRGVSAWQFLLSFADCDQYDVAPIGQIFKLFINYGADPLETISISDGPWECDSSELEMRRLLKELGCLTDGHKYCYSAINLVHVKKFIGRDKWLTALGLELSQMLMARSQENPAALHCLTPSPKSQPSSDTLGRLGTIPGSFGDRMKRWKRSQTFSSEDKLRIARTRSYRKSVLAQRDLYATRSRPYHEI